MQATRLGTGVIRPPVSPDKVAIYRTSEQVSNTFEEVALMSGSGDYAYTNEEQMYKKMREKAGALGANGIILDSMSEPTTGAKVANFPAGHTRAAQGQGDSHPRARETGRSKSTADAGHNDKGD